MANNTIRKVERLSLKKNIDLLYEKGQSFITFPLRVVYLAIQPTGLSNVSMMVCVPKKKIRKAVGRNYIKRQMREVYRVRKHELSKLMESRNETLLLSFSFLDKSKHSFQDMEAAMTKALSILLNRA